MKKTVKIEELVRWVNERNRTSICAPQVREGWNVMLESILMTTDTYRGFVYLTSIEVPGGQEPGIIRGEDPKDNRFPDETRRHYLMRTFTRRERGSLHTPSRTRE